MSELLELRLLGRLELHRAGELVTEIQANKSLALLSYLAVTARPHTRPALAGLLWGGMPEAKARGNLSKALSSLQRVVGDHLTITRQTVTLEPDSDFWLDVAEFEAGVSDNSIEQLQEAVQLYDGDFLAGFTVRNAPEFEDWVLVQQARLKELALQALHTLAAHFAGQGEGGQAQAIEFTNRLLRLEPWREEAHRQMMRLLALNGQRGAALAQYETCRQLLAEELGVEPDHETTALYEQIRKGQVVAEAAGPAPLPAVSAALILDGRFAISDLADDLLGQGSMGRVYRGRDLHTDTPVAIKALKPDLVAQIPEVVERFIREGEALRRLNHPNIVKLLASVQEADQHYLVLEYAPGGSLRELLETEGPLGISRVVEMALDLADALTRAHRLGIIHRDLKAANVLLTEEGAPRLTDFGIAHLIGERRLTETGLVLGTIDYLSPEAINGETVDGRADIWSFGVLLYEMLAGKRPFGGDTLAATMMAIVRQPVPDLSQHRPDAPKALTSLIQRMLEKEPQQRIASIRLVGAELEAILHSQSGSKEDFSTVPVPPPPVHPPPISPVGRHNLPVQTTPFIGRELEQAELARLLADPAVRLVTILGPGGMGKTRLSLEAAAAQLNKFSHGVYFVSLAPLESPDPMVSTIAEALNFSFYEGGTPQQQLLDHLREKSMLLVLDNFEHVLAGVDFVQKILQTAPATRILVTSRERLKLSGETIFTLEGLGASDDESTTGHSAIQLFNQTARQLQPDFEPIADDLDAIGHICRLVQDMPLGIILAATWLELLSPAEIAAEIRKSLDFLESDLRDLPERQRSMRAVFDHSWQLLNETEQLVFQQLSVFRGGFGREAAETVTGATLRTLMSLVNKSLLQRTSEGRYNVHELLRQYAAERLTDSEAQVRERHAAHYCTFLDHREAELKGSGQQAVLTELEADHENIRIAWRWAVEQAQIEQLEQALESLGLFYLYRGRLYEGEAMFRLATEPLKDRSPAGKPDSDAAPDSPDQARFQVRVLIWLSRYNNALRQFDMAEHSIRQAQALLDSHPLAERDTRSEQAHLLVERAALAMNDSFVEAKDLVEQSLALHQGLDDPWYRARALENFGHILTWGGGQIGEARRVLEECLALRQRLGDVRGIARSLMVGGIARSLMVGGSSLEHQRQFEEGERLIRRGISIVRDIDDQPLLEFALNSLAASLMIQGKFSESIRLREEHLKIRANLGLPETPLHVIGFLQMHLGQYEEAKSYLNRQLPHFRETDNKNSVGYALHNLGRIALVQDRFKEAQELQQQSLKIFRNQGEAHGASAALGGLGYTALKLNNPGQAQIHLLESLQLVNEHRKFLPAMAGLTGVALLLINQGQKERAVEIYGLVRQQGYVANSRWFEDVAGREIAEVAATLPPNVAVALNTRGRALDLWETINELLEELSKPGSGALSVISTVPNNLPVQTTPFIGRESELAELARLLAEQAVRLVTILGPGGMGKTRLALEVAGRQLSHFEHGAYFVRLAPLNVPDSIVPAIAEAVNFSFYEGGTQAQQLQDYLREKRLLLVLDNYEHLLEGVGVVVDLLRVAPGLKMLATSRARLNVQEEHRFPISGIDLPETASQEVGNQSSAVQLFLESARRVKADFALTDENSEPPVAQICRLVQGMPLGIILAATWLELLAPAEIAVELARSLDFLETEMRDLPERQRSMRAVFDHSWRLLSEPEQEVFQQLTIFRGGFTREAAEAVTGVSLRVLLGLANKSLLQRVSAGRFEVHEFVRQYGAEKLAEDPAQETAVRDRHCDYYCAFLHQHEADLKGARQQTALAEIEAILENVRLAWTWAIDNGKIEAINRALDSLYEFYHIRSRFQDGYDDFDRAVIRLQAELQTSNDVRGGEADLVFTRLLARQSAFGYALSRYEAAGKLIRQSLELARRLDMLQEQAFCLNILGDIEQVQVSYPESEQRYQESLAISQAIDDELAKAASLEKWGSRKMEQGDHDRAYQLFRQSLSLYRALEYQFGMAKLFSWLGLAASTMGQYPEAEQFWSEGLAISKEIGNSLGMAKALGGLGLVAWSKGKASLPQAKQLFQERLAIFREIGHRSDLEQSFCLLAHIHNDLGEHKEARTYAQEALALAKTHDHTFNTMWSLIILGEAAAGFKDFQSAWNHSYETLKIGSDTQTHPQMILIALVNLAFLLSRDRGQFKPEAAPQEEVVITKSNERAIEILTQVINHPATWQIYKDKAARLRTEVETELPPETVAAAIERSEAKTLEGVVAEILDTIG